MTILRAVVVCGLMLSQVQPHLHLQLDDLLQQLLQLASTLQSFAEHNQAVSQQLQLLYGATSKVIETHQFGCNRIHKPTYRHGCMCRLLKS